MQRNSPNFLHKPPALLNFRSLIHDLAVTVELYQFSLAEPAAYAGSYRTRSYLLWT